MAPHLMSPAFTAQGKKELPDAYTQDKVVIWPISFSQSMDFISDKGRATLRLLAAHQGPTYIMRTNTLARHNYKVENSLSEAGALERAQKEGQKWMDWFDKEQKDERDQDKNSKKVPHAQILDWDYWKQQEGYQAVETMVENLYASNADFSAVVMTTALDYARSKITYFPNKLTELHQASIAYLKEEVIVTLLWIQMLQKQHPNMKIVQMYPKDPNPVLEYLYSKILTATQRNQFEFATIHFDKKPVARAMVDNHPIPPHLNLNNGGELVSPEGTPPPPQAYLYMTTLQQKHIETLQEEVKYLRSLLTMTMGMTRTYDSALQAAPIQSHTSFNPNAMSLYQQVITPSVSTASTTGDALLSPQTQARHLALTSTGNNKN